MAWFKKEEKKVTLPNLPGAERLPELPPPPGKENLPDLRISSLPFAVDPHPAEKAIKYEVEKPVSGEMLKSNFQPLPMAVSKPEPIIAEPARVVEGLPKTVEMTEMKPVAIPSKIKKLEPIYVRLDKFKAGLEAFEEIKDGIGEIEEFLDKIKQIKEKEGKELEEWEREVQILKSRIEAIDNSVFKKMD